MKQTDLVTNVELIALATIQAASVVSMGLSILIMRHVYARIDTFLTV